MNFDWADINILPDAFPFLVNNEFISDVKFQFHDKKYIYAHKFILCLRSPEFFKFFKESAFIKNIIQIDHVSSESFLEFIKFLYTDELEINQNNAADLMKLSIKYRVSVLEAQCKEIIFCKVSEENVCTFLDVSVQENWIEQQKLCLNFIAKNYGEVLKSKSILEINQNTLKEIIDLDPVSDVKEFDIFKTIIMWADRACERDGSRPSGCNQRNKLGDIVKIIRLGAMTPKDFSKCQDIAPDLLEKDEIIAIFNSIASKRNNSLGFPHKPRKILVNDQKMEFKNFGSLIFSDHLNAANYYSPSQLIDTFYVEFSGTMVFKIEKVYLNIFDKFLNENRPNVNYEIFENGKIFQTGKQELIGSAFSIHPVTVIPNNRYRIAYTFELNDLAVMNRIIARKYESNEPSLLEYSRKRGFELTIFENNSHINHFKFNYY